MIVPDINLLLYAYDSESPFHAKAAEWWRQCVTGSEGIGLLPVVIFGFVRIATNPRIYQCPMTVAEATEQVRSWLRQPLVGRLDPGQQHVHQVLQLLEDLGTASNMTTDAQIAAAVLSHKAILHTSDADFARFPGLRWFNPITGLEGSSRLPRKGQR